jgi:ATP-dependent helicase HrpA
VQNGICVRLFAEADYRSRPLYTRPEILRANLAEVILRMMALRLGDIGDFPFIDRPDSKSIRDGYDLLYELGAITARRTAHGARRTAQGDTAQIPPTDQRSARRIKLTEKGRLMARIPLDPRLARMLLEAKDRGCIDQIAVIAAALSIQDPRERPLEKTAEADQAHAQFDDPISDFTTLLNIWNRYDHIRQTRKSGNALKRFCRQNFLSYNRMREWRDIHYQIRTILEEFGEEFGLGKRPRAMKVRAQNLNLDREQPLYQSIHQSILSGYLSNIAEKKEKNVYRATQNREVMVFPGSGLFDRAGRWVVAAEMVETSRLFARTVANIESHWLEALGGELCRRTYLNPRWQKNQSAVMADEQVSLFGLIIGQRAVPYGPVNPDEAADIFIRSAVLRGDIKKPLAFMTHNQRLIDDIQRLENRLRRRDLLISDEALFDFYAAKLPGVYSLQMLKDQIKKRGGDRFLRLKKQDLLNYDPDAGELARYPLSTKIKGQRFTYRYHFQPGEDDDGVTIQVPVSMAASVPTETFDWLVPGLIKEKIEALIKGLPKIYRKKLVPVNETVEIIHRELPGSGQALVSALGEFILQRFGVDIPAAAWPIESLPDHLKMRISMIAPDGRVLRSSRDTGILLQSTKDSIPADAFESYRKKWQRTGISRWDFGDLPEFISSPPEARSKWVAYPALEAGEDPVKSVRLTLYLQQDKALAIHRYGVAGLYKIRFAKDLKILKKGLKLPAQHKAATDYFGGPGRIAQQLLDRVVSDLFCKNIRSQNAFEAHGECVSPILISTGQKLLESCLAVLKTYHQVRAEFDRLNRAHSANTAVHHFCEDLTSALERLVPDSFIQLYDAERLAHIERYIHAMQIRARRALLDFEKDQAKDRQVKNVADRLEKLLQALSANATVEKRKALEDLFWMIEEYKISIFAQELRTAYPVSKKRLEKKLAEIERMI